MSEHRLKKTCEQLGVIFIPKDPNCSPAEDEERLELLRQQIIAKRAKKLVKVKLIRQIAATPFGRQLLLGRELYKRGYTGRCGNASINTYLKHLARRSIAATRRPTSDTSFEPDLAMSSYVNSSDVLRPFVQRSGDINNRNTFSSYKRPTDAILPEKVSSIFSQNISS